MPRPGCAESCFVGKDGDDGVSLFAYLTPLSISQGVWGELFVPFPVTGRKSAQCAVYQYVVY